jgi:hypothetical protein
MSICPKAHLLLQALRCGGAHLILNLLEMCGLITQLCSLLVQLRGANLQASSVHVKYIENDGCTLVVWLLSGPSSVCMHRWAG